MQQLRPARGGLRAKAPEEIAGRNGNSPSEEGYCQSLRGHPCHSILCTNPHLSAELQTLPKPAAQWAKCRNKVFFSVEKGSSWALSTCRSRWPLRGQAPAVLTKLTGPYPCGALIAVGAQYSAFLKITLPALTGVAQWVGCPPANRKVAHMPGFQTRSLVGGM